MIPIILSGGTGARLWPLSRTLRPKQFLDLTGEQTLFQMTLERLKPLLNDFEPIVVANEAHRFLVADQCLEVGIRPMALLLEPHARNTAPAIAAAAIAAQANGEDPLLLVLPSDHVISNLEAFSNAVRVAESAAQDGAIVIFGIVPTTPETGYGYVKTRPPDDAAGGNSPVSESGKSYSPFPVFTVDGFVEKPDVLTAKSYLDHGHYFWNSGMFVFKASVILEELSRHSPEILSACRNAYHFAKRDLDFTRLDREAFAASPCMSIDYAVMERTDRAVLVPLDAGWSDVGAWSAIWGIQSQDNRGNSIRGDVLLYESTSCYVHSENRLVSLVGVDNLVVIETGDAVLVANKDKAQDVKKVVELLRSNKRVEADLHRKVFRPWGTYELIGGGDRYQVKRISVKPGARLSLQMHRFRAEHWVVVRGVARVTIGEEVKMLVENQSIFIPLGARHCLENSESNTLELIEIQSGSYLGEDDIVRFDDKYGRL